MATIRVICQCCGFSREVPEEKLPDRPVQVTCPKCGRNFTFIKSPAPVTNPSAPLPLPKTDPAVEMVREVAYPPADGAEQESRQPLPSPRPAGRAATLAAAPVPAATPAPLGLVILLLLLVIGAAWWLNYPSLTTVPDGAHVDNKNGFAVKAPADWLLITPENLRTIFNQFSDKLPTEIAGLIGKGKPGFTVSFMKIPGTETAFAPNFNLAVIDTKGKNLPALTDSEKDKASDVVSKELARMLPGYRLIETRIVQVDGIAALQITGEAELTITTRPATPVYSEPGAFGMRRITGHTEAEKQTYKVRAVQTMIPGKKRAYAFNFMYDELNDPGMERLHGEVLESFRLLERPPRYGGIVMGGLNGGLFGAGLYLLGLVIGRFFRSRE